MYEMDELRIQNGCCGINDLEVANIDAGFEVPHEFTQCSFMELLSFNLYNQCQNDNGDGVGNDESEERLDDVQEVDKNGKVGKENSDQPIEAEEGTPDFLFEDLELSDEEGLFDDTDDRRCNKVKLTLLKKKEMELRDKKDKKKKNGVDTEEQTTRGLPLEMNLSLNHGQT
ncbi:hypothetical protein DM860_002782 [Cuscuta australis]|uniref:Uncharacterized protein n=1 Tax=Cuscuta australis TaxID=267555 RepID=A0A328D4E0_9ASTE|nr:hypothetical protein DM860_002782 [Cuscuta australis]